MRLLVTGAGGFLGRHVVAAAAARGWTPLRMTRASGTNDPQEIAMGLGPWSRQDFAHAILASRPDAILHLAGATGQIDRRAVFEANTLLAGELLNAVEEQTLPPKLILIGSAAEYGFVPAGAQPVAETWPCQPVSDYGIAKYAQALLGLAAAARGMAVLVVRLFNPVGLDMPPHLALPSFARQLVGPAGDQVTIRTGNLDVSRDFIAIEDAADILLDLAQQSRWPWPLVNLCSGHAFRLRDLLDQMVTASGLRVTIETNPAMLRPGDMPVLTGDIVRLADLRLAPKVPNFETLLPALLAEARETRR